VAIFSVKSRIGKKNIEKTVGEIMENDDLMKRIASAKQLYAVQNYQECSSLIQVPVYDHFVLISFERKTF
jgi:hypothetical protein